MPEKCQDVIREEVTYVAQDLYQYHLEEQHAVKTDQVSPGTTVIFFSFSRKYAESHTMCLSA